VIKRSKQIAPLHGPGILPIQRVMGLMAAVVNGEIIHRRECWAEVFENASHVGYLTAKLSAVNAQAEDMLYGALSGIYPHGNLADSEEELGTSKAKAICFAHKLQEAWKSIDREGSSQFTQCNLEFLEERCCHQRKECFQVVDFTIELKKAKVRKGEVCNIWDIQPLPLQFMGRKNPGNANPEYNQLAQEWESSEQVIWMVAGPGFKHKSEGYEACGSRE